MHHDTSLWADPRFWVGLAFFLFFAVFGRKLIGSLLVVLDKRSLAIKHELEEASRLRQEAEAMLADANSQASGCVARRSGHAGQRPVGGAARR